MPGRDWPGFGEWSVGRLDGGPGQAQPLLQRGKSEGADGGHYWLPPEFGLEGQSFIEKSLPIREKCVSRVGGELDFATPRRVCEGVVSRVLGGWAVGQPQSVEEEAAPDAGK